MQTLETWPIIITVEPAPAEEYAAGELQALLRQATGFSFPIERAVIARGAGHRAAAGQPAIRIGGASRLSTDDLGTEDVRIRIAQPGIDLAGGSQRGTLYAVYDFAERVLGVRFLTYDHTHVPEVPRERTLKEDEWTFRPPFRWRHSHYGVNREHPEFGVRLRQNTITGKERLGGRVPWDLILHTVDKWVPVGQLGAAHPEYFSLVDGRRRSYMRDDQFEQGGTQPCYAHPEVQQRITEGVLARLVERKQTAGNVAIGQNDNQMFCRCPQCAQIDEREESHAGALLTAVNAAAVAVSAVQPDVFVGTLAYQFSRTPPRHLTVRSNVAIQLCSIEACLLHALDDPGCAQNAAFCRDLDGWRSKTGQIYVWNYNVNFASYLAPCPNLRVIGPNLRYLASRNVKGVFLQGAGDARNTELCDLRNYLSAALLWDPSRDEVALIDEFVRLHYGLAAPHVLDYLALIHASGQQSGRHNDCYGLAADYGIDEETARQGQTLLASAAAAAENDVMRSRVRKLMLGPLTALIDPVAQWYRRHLRQIRSGEVTKFPPEAYAGREQELRQLFSLFREFEINRVSERVPRDEFEALFPDSLTEKKP